jgi:hypothetical protein
MTFVVVRFLDLSALPIPDFYSQRKGNEQDHNKDETPTEGATTRHHPDYPIHVTTQRGGWVWRDEAK